MAQSYSSKIVFSSTDPQLSKLLELGQTRPQAWSDAEMGAMVQHQMSAPLQIELERLGLPMAEQQGLAAALSEATRASITTVGDLFQNPEPPLKLLELSKSLFKQRIAKAPKESPQHRLYYVFYLLSIVAARVRQNTNISKLTDTQQLQAIDSMSKRAWIGEAARELLAAAREKIA